MSQTTKNQTGSTTIILIVVVVIGLVALGSLYFHRQKLNSSKTSSTVKTAPNPTVQQPSNSSPSSSDASAALSRPGAEGCGENDNGVTFVVSRTMTQSRVDEITASVNGHQDAFSVLNDTQAGYLLSVPKGTGPAAVTKLKTFSDIISVKVGQNLCPINN